MDTSANAVYLSCGSYSPSLVGWAPQADVSIAVRIERGPHST